MPSTYRLHRQAHQELNDAINWYNSKGGKKLATRFFRAYQKLRERIVDKPFQFPEIDDSCRQAVFKNYPYVIIFYPTDDEVYILAIFHTSRNPEEWQVRT